MPRLPFEPESAASIPRCPGVYIFLDAKAKAVYVGKALMLRPRIRSYFKDSDETRPVARLLGPDTTWIDYIVTDSEREALVLENTLIKRHRPRLNIRLRDDKTYFSLRLDPEESWPRLTVVRRRPRDRALYFGPYTSAYACRRTIRYLGAVFPLRTCPDSVLHNRTRPCISYDIGRCVAPCVDLVDRETYGRLVQRVIRFLSGQDREVIEELEQEMHAAAERLEFERAAEFRDRLAHIRKTVESPVVVRKGSLDRDVVGLGAAGERSLLVVLHVRSGNLAASSTFTVRGPGGEEAVMDAFLGQFYSAGRPPPAEILIPRASPDLELHREVLREVAGRSVRIRVPERGEGRRLLELARRNAELCVLQHEERAGRDRDLLAALQERLALMRLPERIECYDISHLGGEHVVGSGVAFTTGRPDKARYRRYRLREVQRNDDFAALEEVVRRRLERGVRQDDLPDLMVIDGGRPQLDRVCRVFRELGVDGVDVVALAKARRGGSAVTSSERVVLADRDEPIILEPGRDEVGHLLQRVRDEAHRFALAYNRELRSRETIGSALEQVPGIGRAKAAALLRRFGGLQGVREAGVEALSETPGIPLSLARRVLAHLAREPDPQDRG